VVGRKLERSENCKGMRNRFSKRGGKLAFGENQIEGEKKPEMDLRGKAGTQHDHLGGVGRGPLRLAKGRICVQFRDLR